MIGGTVSEVVESKCEGWAAGDLVVGYYGWEEYTIATPDDLVALSRAGVQASRAAGRPPRFQKTRRVLESLQGVPKISGVPKATQGRGH